MAAIVNRFYNIFKKSKIKLVIFFPRKLVIRILIKAMKNSNPGVFLVDVPVLSAFVVGHVFFLWHCTVA
jgi:hypothetical protein